MFATNSDFVSNAVSTIPIGLASLVAGRTHP